MNPSVTLKWSSRFPLKESYLNDVNGLGGVYCWGFDGTKGEVIWYVGKASFAKGGIYPRLRKHYLDAMSGQYQIPLGFFNEKFLTKECSASAWRLERNNSAQAATLEDWSKAVRIFRAAHAFANSAFARVAELSVPDAELKNIERYAIKKLNPVINKQRKEPDLAHVVNVESSSEIGWVESAKNRNM